MWRIKLRFIFRTHRLRKKTEIRKFSKAISLKSVTLGIFFLLYHDTWIRGCRFYVGKCQRTHSGTGNPELHKGRVQYPDVRNFRYRKIHTAIGLGIKTCMERALYISLPYYICSTKKGKLKASRRCSCSKRGLRNSTLSSDEVGYVGFDKEGEELLFSHLSYIAKICDSDNQNNFYD